MRGTVTRIVLVAAALCVARPAAADDTGSARALGALKGIAYFAGTLYAVDVERIRKIVLP